MNHFMAGKVAIEAKDWERATRELRGSLESVNSPNARLELARALREWSKPAEAWAEYGRVIEDATKLAAKEERYSKTADAATGERAELEAKLAFVALTVHHAPPNALLKAGGRPVPTAEWGAPIVVSPGAVDVVLADASGKELARKTVAASVGAKTAVELDGQPPPPPVALVVPEETPVPSPPPAPMASTSAGSATILRSYAYLAAGVGVAGMGAFALFGVMSQSAYSDLQSACHPGCPADKRGEISSGRTDQTVANVGLAVGLAGVATGVGLFIASATGRSSATESTGLIISPGYVGWRGAL